MAKRYYLAEHEGQRDTGPLEHFNCAAAAGAMLADQATLGIKDPTPQWFRHLTGDKEGGLQASAVAGVLDELGIEVRLYDYRDNLKWSKLKTFLERGWFAVVAGDYDVVPAEFQGSAYDGFHSVLYHQRYKVNQRVGDPLLRKWVKWPNDLAYRYVRKFDQQTSGGIYAVVMVPRYAYLRSEASEAVIRSAPERGDNVIGTMVKGDKLVAGGTVKGEEVAAIDRWHKVWVSSVEQAGYVHWTVAWLKR